MKKLQGFDSKEQYARQLFQLSDNKTIIFANTQKQADKLCKHSVHSKNKKSDENLEMFKDGTINKLSAVEQLSEGVTIPELKTGIIMLDLLYVVYAKIRYVVYEYRAVDRG